MPRNIVITAGDGQTGHCIAELILTDDKFSDKVENVTVLTTRPDAELCKDLESKGAKVVGITRGDKAALVKTLKESGADTLCLIPPANKQKFKLAQGVVEGAKEAGIQNCLLISSAGADMAEENKQPRLREFIKLETLVLTAKGGANVKFGHSPCVIRAGFYAENLLHYNRQAKTEGKLLLPVGDTHKFAPVVLGDIAQIAGHVLTGEGPHGFDDRHRGQLIVATGPMLASGNEIAAAASQALGSKLEYQNISEEEAKEILDKQADIDDVEKEYLLEYYSLVREGKANYISTHAFHDITGEHPMELVDFFKAYESEFKPKKRKTEK